MIHQVWRLNEPGDHNLGLACTEQGLLLGRTPLIERRNGRFAVRERSEIERLLSRAYRAELPLERLMAGLSWSSGPQPRTGRPTTCGASTAGTAITQEMRFIVSVHNDGTVDFEEAARD
jgi:hypothetical protein